MLNEQQVKAFNHVFKVFDKNGNDNIAADDFMKTIDAIKAQIPASQATKMSLTAQRWFLSLKTSGGDSNKDNQISNEEWLAWADGFATDVANTSAISSKYRHFVNALFDSMTIDDETFSVEEYALWFKALGLKGDAEAIFKSLAYEGKDLIYYAEFKLRVQEFVLAEGNAAGCQLFGDM